MAILLRGIWHIRAHFKEAPQAPPLRSISAYGGDEVSRYDQTRKDNSLENNRFASLLISYPWTSSRGQMLDSRVIKGIAITRAPDFLNAPNVG